MGIAIYLPVSAGNGAIGFVRFKEITSRCKMGLELVPVAGIYKQDTVDGRSETDGFAVFHADFFQFLTHDGKINLPYPIKSEQVVYSPLLFIEIGLDDIPHKYIPLPPSKSGQPLRSFDCDITHSTENQ